MTDGNANGVVRRKGEEGDQNNSTKHIPSPPRRHRSSNGHLSEPLRRRKSYDSAEGNPDQSELALAIGSAFLPEWVNLVGIISLIFGGCCSNVFALEAIVKEVPDSGTLITFFQVFLTALFTLPKHLDSSRGIRHLYLKPRSIPIYQWAFFAALFITINILNNKAFGYHISVPLHIILRSAGPVATMAIGYLAGGRRYRPVQILAVILLFLGVVQAAISDARAKGAQIQFSSSSTSSTSTSSSSTEFWTGFSILFIALVLSAFMGLFTDRLYARHGRGNSDENLFYSHLLSLPFFFFRLPKLQTQVMALVARSPSSSAMLLSTAEGGGAFSAPLRHLLQLMPVQLLFLLGNGLTQFVCIRGVNQLSAKTSSLTVGIVLNIRKLASLLLSIWLFGNKLDSGVLTGAAIVFIGGALYAWPASKPKAAESEEGTEGRKVKEL